MKPKFKPTQNGLVIIDPIERRRYRLETNTSVTPTPVADDRIPYPMDTTVEIVTDGFRLLSDNSVYVRNLDGALVAEAQANKELSLPRGEYIIDISGPLKVYTIINSSVRVYSTVDQTEITFGKATPAVLSARSYHTSPAARITTSSDPADMMQAVSMFGSALKTTASERSYPTLRGHPPAIELTDKLNIPDELSRPNTGLRVEVPTTLKHIFVVAPLAYYLAAKVVPGSTPRLVTESGYSYPLEGEDGFEIVVDQVLRELFLLDCIVRTEGKTPLPLHERQAIESVLEFNLEDMYGRTIGERVESYLEVPFTTIESVLPEWRLQTKLKPLAEHVEFLPFVVNDLSTISVSRTSNGSQLSRMQNKTIENGIQTNASYEPDQTSDYNRETQSPSLSETPPVQQLWKNENKTEIASLGILPAFRNSITQSPRDDLLKIEVVCNDPDMNKELVTVHSAYQDRNDISLDVTVHYDLTVDDLKEIFIQESDFVHYIGHIDPEGFRCSDGTLDARDIETVGAKAFILNACQSYSQGLSLIEAGAIGGIVTFNEIQNETAVTVGSTIARLLNRGLPLYAALHILQKSRKNADQYYIIGDGTLTIVQTSQGSPTASTITQNGNKRDIIIDSYITSHKGLGSIYNPVIMSSDSYRLAFGKVCLHAVTTAELVEFLNTETFPVLLEGKLRWSTDIKTHEL